MSNNKPTPLCYRAPPPDCPICGTPSYSASGVHPQCCSRQIDAERMRRLKQVAPPADHAAAGSLRDDSNAAGKRRFNFPRAPGPTSART